MSKLKKRLAAIGEKLGVNRVKLRRARKRRKHFTARAIRKHNRALAAEVEADRRRANGHTGRKMDRVAQRRHRHARQASDRAQWWVARIKELLRKIDHLEKSEAELQAELDVLAKKHKLKFDVEKNTVTGGTVKQRFRGAALLAAKRCANGKRRNFYSQPGRYTVGQVFTGEKPGERSDCSQFVTSVCKAAGMADPNGTDWSWGYTGTLVEEEGGWKKATESALRAKGWGFVVYGSGTGFHVEAYVGPGDRTIGHGSAPIDEGRIDLFGNGNYRCYVHND